MKRYWRGKEREKKGGRGRLGFKVEIRIMNDVVGAYFLMSSGEKKVSDKEQ